MAMNQKLLRPKASGKFYKSLRVNLQAYWRLDETAVSGNVSALDSIGTNNLTSTNSVLSTTGLIGTGRNFTAASLQTLSVADSAAAQFGDGDWCISLWHYTTTLTGNNDFVISRCTANRGVIDYRIFRPGGNNSIRFYTTYTDGTGANLVDSSNSFVPNSWNFIAVSHNSGVVTIQLNGTRTTANRAAGKAFANTAGLLMYVGGEGSPAAASGISGKLDEICKWTRALSNTELDVLYNAGAGINLNK